MLCNAMDRPITGKKVCHTLYLYCDLSEEAKNNAFGLYDNEEDARWYLDFEFEDIRAARVFFEEQTSTNFIRFDDYRERWYASPLVDVYNGWGVMRDFAAIDENAYNLWSEYDALHAWNKHASRFAYLYQRCEELRDEDAPNQYAHGFDWYEEKYRKELEKAISDVCDALNADWDACRDWVDTRGFFEKEYLERDEDNEHWYTQDGKREFLRDARDNVWDHDTCEEMELIFSNRSPMRLYVRETIED